MLKGLLPAKFARQATNARTALWKCVMLDFIPQKAVLNVSAVKRVHSPDLLDRVFVQSVEQATSVVRVLRLLAEWAPLRVQRVHRVVYVLMVLTQTARHQNLVNSVKLEADVRKERRKCVMLDLIHRKEVPNVSNVNQEPTQPPTLVAVQIVQLVTNVILQHRQSAKKGSTPRPKVPAAYPVNQGPTVPPLPLSPVKNAPLVTSVLQLLRLVVR